jgi:hypothetical protein
MIKIIMTAMARYPSPPSHHLSRRITPEQQMEEDHEVFVECMHKNVDVFLFLGLDHGDTSFSSSSSSSSSLHGVSCCPDDEETELFFDTTHALEEEERLELVDDGVGFDSSYSDDVESLFPDLSSSFDDDNDDDDIAPRRLELPEIQDDEQSQRNEAGNPMEFAFNVVHNIWEGSKKTPVGFAVKVTEGVFGSLLGMIHRDNREHEVRSLNETEGREPSLPRTDELDFLDVLDPHESESVVIAEPDPLDASEFVLECSHRDVNTSAILSDCELDKYSFDSLTDGDLKRRLDVFECRQSDAGPDRGIWDTIL